MLYPPTLIFVFNATPTTEIYTLSLHDALPIFPPQVLLVVVPNASVKAPVELLYASRYAAESDVELILLLKVFQSTERSEEHTSELQSRENLVCRLLLEKKKKERRLICPLPRI